MRESGVYQFFILYPDFKLQDYRAFTATLPQEHIAKLGTTYSFLEKSLPPRGTIYTQFRHMNQEKLYKNAFKSSTLENNIDKYLHFQNVSRLLSVFR